MLYIKQTRASINIWRTHSNFRHIFTRGHEILWIYRSGQFWNVSYYSFNWNTLHRSDISSNIQKTLWNTVFYFIGNKQAHTTQVHQVDQSINKYLEKHTQISDISLHEDMKSFGYIALDNFGISVTTLSTETPYTVQTYRQTFRKPCEI